MIGVSEAVAEDASSRAGLSSAAARRARSGSDAGASGSDAASSDLGNGGPNQAGDGGPVDGGGPAADASASEGAVRRRSRGSGPVRRSPQTPVFVCPKRARPRPISASSRARGGRSRASVIPALSCPRWRVGSAWPVPSAASPPAEGFFSAADCATPSLRCAPRTRAVGPSETSPLIRARACLPRLVPSSMPGPSVPEPTYGLA